VATVEFIASLFNDGYAIPSGAGDWDTPDNAFLAGQTAMTLESTSCLRNFTNQSAGKFDLGVAFLPYNGDATYNGIVPGGGSVWIISEHPQEEIDAAWEFVQFLASFDGQTTFPVNTGYFPTRTDVQTSPQLSEFYAQNPNFRIALDQLNASMPSFATAGGLFAEFPAARNLIIEAEQKVLNGQATVQEALDEAAAKANEAITQYNRLVAAADFEMPEVTGLLNTAEGGIDTQGN